MNWESLIRLAGAELLLIVVANCVVPKRLS